MNLLFVKIKLEVQHNEFKNKKGLGRGLSSLIGETKVENQTNKLLLSEISTK